jgi:hypothetical protein
VSKSFLLLTDTKAGAGEVRFLGLGLQNHGLATVEPMDGNQVVVNFKLTPCFTGKESRFVLDDSLAEGHASGSADLLGNHRHQIVAGQPATNKDKKVGIKLYVPLDEKCEKWHDLASHPSIRRSDGAALR